MMQGSWLSMMSLQSLWRLILPFQSLWPNTGPVAQGITSSLTLLVPLFLLNYLLMCKYVHIVLVFIFLFFLDLGLRVEY